MVRPQERLMEPLRFRRIPLEKVWGGRALERTPGIALPPGVNVGETWELVDRPTENSIVDGGPFDGRSLGELMRTERDAILGRAKPAHGGGFPLLIKLLDATQALSVQVHPHRAVARSLPAGDHPKTEAWYILDARKDSAIYLGLRPDVDAKTFEKEARGPGVVDLLVKHEVEAGQFYFVPGGTVHAIGAGVTLVEVQETSDTTYRLYDWGRTGTDGKPRPVHVDEALRVITFGGERAAPRTPALEPARGGAKRASLVDCEEFAIELIEASDAFESDTSGVALVYIVLAGRGHLESARGESRSPLAPGDTWLVPASVGAHRVRSTAPGFRFLRVSTKA